MDEKLFIECLSRKIANYNTPEQAISQANSCDSLSSDIYTDYKRFIYELLQNADDANNQNGKLDFQIDFSGQYIIISHKGDPFNEIDIKSICSVGDGNKRSDENKTGFKGIGFKSVFAYSNFVIIKSNNYCFKFDKNASNIWNPNWGDENKWKQERKAENKDDEIKMPWQIIPIWTEIPDELKDLSVFKEDFKVYTIIKHSKIEELKKSLSELFSKSQIILFLRSKEIKITINSFEKLVLEKQTKGETTILKKNNEIISEWLIKTIQFDIPDKIKKQIKDNIQYPRKLRESFKTELSFAIQIEEEKLKVCDPNNRLIFTYLPTSINYGFPFLVNANFLTDAGREKIRKDLEWNQWLFEQIPLKYLSWIAELANPKSKYNKQILAILPDTLSGFNELEIKYNEGFQTALKTIAFIPNLEGNLLKVNEALFDETKISEFINKNILLEYINQAENENFSASSFIPFSPQIKELKKLGVKFFDKKNLMDFFKSEIFVHKHTLPENFKLINFFTTVR
jgi:hypothetical protein